MFRTLLESNVPTNSEVGSITNCGECSRISGCTSSSNREGSGGGHSFRMSASVSITRGRMHKGQLSNTPVSSRSVWDCACRSAAGDKTGRLTMRGAPIHCRWLFMQRNVDINPGTQKVCKAAYIFCRVIFGTEMVEVELTE